MSDYRSTRDGRITDERPWWDTFPWWSLVIVGVLVWMGWQIVVDEDYALAWERIIPGLGLTLKSTVYAFGIALAIALLEARGFTPEDFAMSHPGGSLGRRLLLKVDDIMHAGEQLPVVASGTSLSEALLEMTRKGLGMTAITRDDGTLAGIFTDGDLRRMLDRDIDIRKATIDEVMVAQPITIEPGRLAAEALQIAGPAARGGGVNANTTVFH